MIREDVLVEGFDATCDDGWEKILATEDKVYSVFPAGVSRYLLFDRVKVAVDVDQRELRGYLCEA